MDGQTDRQGGLLWTPSGKPGIQNKCYIKRPGGSLKDIAKIWSNDLLKMQKHQPFKIKRLDTTQICITYLKFGQG